MEKMHIKVTFTEEVLGTASSNAELHSEFIASKAPDAMSREQEIAALGVRAVEEKGTTVFPRTEDGKPCMYDYQWKGAFKDSCGMLRRADFTESAKLKAFKKEIDGLIFVEPRMIPFELPENGKIGTCQRPLRATTPQGERVALAASESVPAGSTMEFDIILLKASLKPLVIEWLDYGKYHGIGQWRNAGKGRYEYELVG